MFLFELSLSLYIYIYRHMAASLRKRSEELAAEKRQAEEAQSSENSAAQSQDPDMEAEAESLIKKLKTGDGERPCEEAAKAIAGVDGHRLRGRRLVVNMAVKKSKLTKEEATPVTAGSRPGGALPRRVRRSAEARPRRSGRNPRRG